MDRYLTPQTLEQLAETAPETLVTAKLNYNGRDERRTLNARYALHLAKSLEEENLKHGHIRELWISKPH